MREICQECFILRNNVLGDITELLLIIKVIFVIRIRFLITYDF